MDVFPTERTKNKYSFPGKIVNSKTLISYSGSININSSNSNSYNSNIISTTIVTVTVTVIAYILGPAATIFLPAFSA